MATVHATASIPTQAAPRTYGWGTPLKVSKFDDHELKICHDQGLYRHLCFMHCPVPLVAPEHQTCAFEIFTAPGSLAVSGDMGTYVFARLEDMFVFFETPAGQINPDYWAEKVTAQAVHAPVRTYSQAAFRRAVEHDYQDRRYEFDLANQVRLWHSVQREVLESPLLETEQGARDVLRAFEFAVTYQDNTRVVFNYRNASGWNLTDYHPRFIWCLEAIVFGIEQYKKQTGHV